MNLEMDEYFLSDSSEEDDGGAFEEAIEDDVLSVEGTRQLAESWKRRYSHQSASEMSDDDDEEAESSEWSCERHDAEDEDGSSTATEGDALARELILRQNERLLERAKRRREHDSEVRPKIAFISIILQ
jgi:hypothetical protein